MQKHRRPVPGHLGRSTQTGQRVKARVVAQRRHFVPSLEVADFGEGGMELGSEVAESQEVDEIEHVLCIDQFDGFVTDLSTGQ